ncbi:hypothetical protein EZ449_21960 [Pedobacter frigidisoli]|uniref:Uncharacterized protein n=1 Tax=Pedobacter frigidisoli TaxID=2530455 RepID=A0A4R0NCS9_9SPHI|nr:hypothetical protein [Pedobacter frigidisoli]TCC97487.1 hypothetical protein EZ449_21960 [Pedobacter frigidisoli]
MSNELKIRIIQDSKGNKLRLNAITIEAVESLKIFLESFTTLANLYDNPSDFKVSLTKGSIESNLIPPTNNRQFNQDIKDIVNGKLGDKDKIKAFRTIQDRIKQNGLSYQVFWKINNKTNDLTNVFKGVNFRYKRNRLDTEFETVFLKGKLFDAGGKTISNIHIEQFDEEFKIECSKDKVIQINQFIYNTVYISAIKSTKVNQRPTYTLIDYYHNQKEQSECEKFHKLILKTHGLEKFDIVHDKLIELLENDNIQFISYLMNIFNNIHTERGIIRTILMTIKPFIKTQKLAMLNIGYESLSTTLRKESLNNRI